MYPSGSPMSNQFQVRPFLAVAVLATATLVIGTHAHSQSLTFDSRTQVSTNNANFDISVFDGNAKYNDRGIGGSEPGAPTFQNILGDGTVLDYNFVGNAGNGSPLTTYASGTAGRIPTPVAPAANVHGNGEDWANVWTTNDPGALIDFSGSTRNHNPTGVAGAANTFARAAEVDGTIDISGLETGQVYIPHGTFVNDWTLTLTMTGAGQPDLVASETQGGNGPNTNFGWITEFDFDNTGLLYDEISYNFTHGDRDGSRARFMGVILDGNAATVVPDPASIAIWSLLGLGLAGFGCYRVRRKK